MEVYSAVFLKFGTKESSCRNNYRIHLKICRKHYILLVIARKVQIGLTKENYIFLDEIVYPSAKEMSFFKKIQKKATL
jgi:hypothetical protein